MNVLLFGATGMVGQAALRECLLDPSVARVLAVGRGPTGADHEKLREIVRSDVTALAPVEEDLASCDACLFCLGVSSVGMSEEEYTRVTYELTLDVARTLVRINPELTFLYVSGAGTDSTERGRTMWARVKGRTENALLRLPFQAAYMFRPGVIIPLHGITSRTTWARLFYGLTKPLHPAMQRLFPHHVTTTERLGRAMITVAREGYARPILETRDINSL